MNALKPAALALLGALLLLPLYGQASISSDIEAGRSADEVIANALAEGLTVDQIADQIAQEVGSANIGMFAGALLRVVAAATDSDSNDASLGAAVNAAIGQAAANNHSGRAFGRAYASNSANFQPMSVSAIRNITGMLAFSSAAPWFIVRMAGVRELGARAGGSGGGGGGAVGDALCEAVGSEPGCLD